MLKSLFAGVSGLQSHQIAMDVESNNIANVNTIGFKYSRANFSDLLSQTSQIATAPQGDLGGKNAVQVGLGTTISSMTRIHSQGSVQNTDKNTDVAIQGDGFFIVSGDSGKTLKYTRSGDFKFDAVGNFVDNNGYVVQGWLRDKETGKVDSTAPITQINIPPGLTTPAKATTQVALKANLNSGDIVQSFSAIRSLDQFRDAADLNRDGILDDKDSLSTPSALYDNLPYADGDANATTNPDRINENSPSHIFTNDKGKIIERGENFGVLVNSTGQSFNLQSGSVGDQGQGAWVGFRSANINPAAAVTVGAIAAGGITINGISTAGVAAAANAPAQAISISAAINAITTQTGVSAIVTGANADQIQLINDNTTTSKNILVGGASSGNLNLSTLTDQPMKKFRFTDGGVNPVGWDAATGGGAVSTADTYYFTTSEDLREGMQQLLRSPDLSENAPPSVGATVAFANDNATVKIDSTGKFLIENPGGANSYGLNIGIDSLVDSGTTENVRFTQMMQALQGNLPSGSTGSRQSQDINVPIHSSSIDVFDSLGSKHTVKIDFRKDTSNPTTGSSWKVMISVPEPGEINVGGGAIGLPKNILEGQVSFTSDGALSTFTPPTITFTGNNGSSPSQNINLAVGTANAFDGLTSFDSKSVTSGISQDGFTGGDLVGIRIDQSGTLVGSFSNGRSFGLAQISMAKFANNEGLATDGGNVYLQSANSGDPIIGTAAGGGRGLIRSSALEASNVDLSRSLTQLIIIQRGFQANGKTITTSDQLLQTLIGLKQ